MNRFKKEEQKKQRALYEGLSEEETILLDLQLANKEKINQLAQVIHRKFFSEEYNFMNDSIVDAKVRKRGINPMNQEYNQKVTLKRQRLGITPLNKNGRAQSKDSFLLCEEIATDFYS